MALRYAALTCKQNKRYRTSARLTKTRDRCCYGNNNGTDGQTDRVRRIMRPPPREEGRIITVRVTVVRMMNLWCCNCMWCQQLSQSGKENARVCWLIAAKTIHPTHCVIYCLKSDASRAYQPFTYYFRMSETSGLMEQRPCVYVVYILL